MADITRADALALLAKQDINEIIKPELSQSASLSAFRTVRMTAGTASMPVLATLPTAGWVTDTGDKTTDVKPTSKATWLDKKLVAEEIAVIVPVHENTLTLTLISGMRSALLSLKSSVVFSILQSSLV